MSPEVIHAVMQRQADMVGRVVIPGFDEALRAGSPEVAEAVAVKAAAAARASEVEAGAGSDGGRMWAEASLAAGVACCRAAKFTPAVDRLREALLGFEALQDGEGVARTLATMGAALTNAMDFDGALDCALKAVAAAEAGGWNEVALCAEMHMAVAMSELGEFEGAETRLIKVAEQAQQGGFLELAARTRVGLAISEVERVRMMRLRGSPPGWIARRLKQLRVYVETAIDAVNGAGLSRQPLGAMARVVEAHCLAWIGKQREAEAALFAVRAAREISDQKGAGLKVSGAFLAGWVELAAAEVAAASADAEGAIGAYGRASALSDRSGDRAVRIASRNARAHLLVSLGRHSEACGVYRELVELIGEALRGATGSRFQSAKIRQKAEMDRAELAGIALHDPLTGLAGRRLLDRMPEEIDRRAPPGDDRLAVAMIDVDDFKRINDERMHSVGDLVLKRIAEIIRGHLRASDVPLRFAGDEFVVVMPGTDAEGALQFAQRIHEAMRQEPWKEVGWPVSVSVGVAAGRRCDALSDLLEQADRAMYRQKAGRGVERAPATAA